MPFLPITSGRLAYDEAGEGPTVILSHASLADRRMWDRQFDALSRRHRVIRYDRLGFGESDDAHGEIDHAADLLALIEALGIERAALVGSSMGGGYSVEVALTAPDRVSALALVCSGLAGWQWPEAMRAETRELILAALPEDRLSQYAAHTAPAVLDADIAAMAEMQVRYLVLGPGRSPADLGPEAWQCALAMARGVFEREWRGPAHIERIPDPRAQDRLTEITAPTLVINGLADSPYVHTISELLVRQIPAAQRVDLPGVGHLPPVECPDRVTAELTDFLAAALDRQDA